MRKKRSSPAAARRPKPKARRPLGDLLPRAPHSTPRASASGAAHRRPGGRREGRPRPRAASSGRWRDRCRAPTSASGQDSGPAGGRQVDGCRPRPHSPLPTARPQDGLGRAPRRARAPLGAPAPQTQPNGFRGACSGTGVGRLGLPRLSRRERPRSHLRVTPL